ncbi:MAG: hypothetical protein JXA33_08780 [Anaerolineae bacterium]|nr:hypothetical protein [Anaerolineae bacterium]
MVQRVKFAKLNESQLEKVQDLEKELGTWVVAVEPEFRLATLTEAQLKRLQAAEHELGVILLAYEHS